MLVFNIRIFRFIAFSGIILIACTALLKASVSLDMTSGPGTYHSSVFNIDKNVTKNVNLKFGYGQASSTTSTTLVKSYSAALSINPDEHWSFGVSGVASPETDDAKSAGWGLNGGYAGGEGNFTWGVSLACNNSITSEFVDYQTLKKRLRNKKIVTVPVDHSQWLDLKQGNFDTSLNAGLFQLIDIAFGFSKYSYDRDLNTFSNNLSRLSGKKVLQNANFGGVSSLVDGFPDHIASVGIALSPFENLKLFYDFSRTVFVLDQPQEDSSTLGLEYTFWSTLKLKFDYNIMAYRDTYITVGLGWLW